MDDIPKELCEDLLIPPVPKIPQNEETLSRMSRISPEMEEVENALKLLLKSQLRVTTAEQAANLRNLIFEVKRLRAEVKAIEQQLQMAESEDPDDHKQFSSYSEALWMDSFGTTSSYFGSSRRGENFKTSNGRSQSSPALADLDEIVRKSDEMSLENKGMWTTESNVWDLDDLTESEGAIDHLPTTEIQSFFDSFVKHGVQSGSSQASPLPMTPEETPLDVRLGQASGKDSPWALGKTRSSRDVPRRLNRYNSVDSEFRPTLVGSMAGNESGQRVSIPFVRNASRDRSSTGGAKGEFGSGAKLASWLLGLTLPGRKKQAGKSCENEAGKVLSRIRGKLSPGLDSNVMPPEGSRRRRKWSLDFKMTSSDTPSLQENGNLKPLPGKLRVRRQSMTLDSRISLSDSEAAMGTAALKHFDSGASTVPRRKNSPLFRGLSLPVHFSKAK